MNNIPSPSVEEGYGYGGKIEQLRKKDFARLEGEGEEEGEGEGEGEGKGPITYLDHAGATLYASSQIDGVGKMLKESVLGNPHSKNPSSLQTHENIEQARKKVLSYFNADPALYSVVFTSGTTASMKLVGEWFSWSKKSTFSYYHGSHNSLLGIRHYASSGGAHIRTFSLENLRELQEQQQQQQQQKDSFCLEEFGSPVLSESHQEGNERDKEDKEEELSLIALPAQCNFSGTILPFPLFSEAGPLLSSSSSSPSSSPSPSRKKQIYTLIDAAAYVGHTPLDLENTKYDFVVFSFYKIFGYPTGLGALIVRNPSVNALKKKYYGGGTLSMSLPSSLVNHPRKENVWGWLEDGTLPFLDISSLRFGWEVVEGGGKKGEGLGGWEAVGRHVESITRYAYQKMKSLRHYNGKNVCVIFGSHESPDFAQGPIISFVVCRPNGSIVGYSDVEFLASKQRIHLRTGCFCNPGSCQSALSLSPEDVKRHFSAGHVCWDSTDSVDGQPTGAIRISFGYMTTIQDIDRFISFLQTHFVVLSPPLPLSTTTLTSSPSLFPSPPSPSSSPSSLTIEGVIVYPVKSCGGYSVPHGQSWELVDTGLKYDRQWALVDKEKAFRIKRQKEEGDEVSERILPLRQKNIPLMATIKPLFEKDFLVLTAPGESPLKIPLFSLPPSSLFVRSHKREGEERVYGEKESEWLSRVLGRGVLLVVKMPTTPKPTTPTTPTTSLTTPTPLNFPNDSQLMAVNAASVDYLNTLIRHKNTTTTTTTTTNNNTTNTTTTTNPTTTHLPSLLSPLQFRPNLVFRDSLPHAEDGWEEVRMGGEGGEGLVMKVMGPCVRCEMININQDTGERGTEPLFTLREYRRNKGKVLFGAHISFPPPSSPTTITVGSTATIIRLSSPS